MKSSVQIWRGFFPSWKFFDKVGSVPRLFWRAGATDEELEAQPWQALSFKAQRKASDIFFNPRAGFQMFSDTLLRQLVQEISPSENENVLENSSSFQLIQNYVFRSLRRSLQREDFHYQFKIQMKAVASESQQEDLLISKIYVGPPG